MPVKVQGVCSYSVYAGPDLEFVVQFRLKSLELKTETATLARKIYGEWAPKVSFKGQIGDKIDKREPLCVYVMDRVKGISHLDFILAHGHPENSPDNTRSRKNLLGDIARFFALSWKNPIQVDPAYRNQLSQTYLKDLRLLLSHLPTRFHSIIQSCIDSMKAIVSLPMVLLHRDFGTCNIMVDEASCHLTGVIDWAEAEICPFGQNLHPLQAFTGALHLKNGWRRYEYYEPLQDIFWGTFKNEVGDLSAETIKIIKKARIMGLLRSRGFTRRLVNMPPPVPIHDDKTGRYNMLSLDGFLVNLATRFDGLG